MGEKFPSRFAVGKKKCLLIYSNWKGRVKEREKSATLKLLVCIVSGMQAEGAEDVTLTGASGKGRIHACTVVPTSGRVNVFCEQTL